MEQTAYSAQQCIMIGDKHYDGEGAACYKMDFIWAKYGYGTKKCGRFHNVCCRKCKGLYHILHWVHRKDTWQKISGGRFILSNYVNINRNTNLSKKVLDTLIIEVILISVIVA